MNDQETTSPSRARKERKDNADRRRRQLLDAARRSVMTNGLARTTLATVAAEAGLSQGVAVFYFKSKHGLLAEALRAHYQHYTDTWRAALDAAGPAPRDRLMALIRADLCEEICKPEALALWFAFWGEQTFTPQYAEISTTFDADRHATIRAICADLFPDRPREDTDRFAEWIDTLTDGYWQRLHLFRNGLTPDSALAETECLVDHLINM